MLQNAQYIIKDNRVHKKEINHEYKQVKATGNKNIHIYQKH